MIESGHQRISHISVESGAVSKSRSDAYKSVMTEKGLAKFIQIQMASAPTEASGSEAATVLVASKFAPTAITTYNDLLAIGAQGATDGDVAVVGYDNTFLANLRQISLTSIDPANNEIALKAAELLLNKSDEVTSKGKVFLLEPKLVIRNSSKSLLKVR